MASDNAQHRLTEEEIVTFFDVASKPGSIRKDAKLALTKRHGTTYSRTTINAVYDACADLLKMDNDDLTYEEAKDMVERLTYKVSARRLIELNNMRRIWKRRNESAEQQKGKEEKRLDFALNDHFRELKEVAAKFHAIQQYLSYYEKDERIDILEPDSLPGLFNFKPPKNLPKDSPLPGNSMDVDVDIAPDFLVHLKGDLPDLEVRQWRELVHKRVTSEQQETIRYLASTGDFKPCEKCTVCKDLSKMSGRRGI